MLLIFDEIATGFGRTGTLFAADHAGVSPDIMCVGKAITGGYLTLAATLCTHGDRQHDQHRRTRRADARADVHGQRAGLRGVGGRRSNCCSRQDWRARVGPSKRACADGLAPARALPGVADVRVLGAIGVIEMDRPVDMAVATPAALRHGVWLRPFRNLVYAMPPYICTPDEVDRITSAMVERRACANLNGVQVT